MVGGALAPREICDGQITYNIVNYPEDQDGLTVSGTVTTDGNIGILDASDIVAWSVTFNNTTFTSAFPDVSETVVGLEATPTELVLPPATDASSSIFILYADGFNNQLYYARDVGIDTYSGATASENWSTDSPMMGGTDPWLIAVAASSVPEPASAVLAVIGAGSVIACGLVRKRRARRRHAAD